MFGERFGEVRARDLLYLFDGLDGQATEKERLDLSLSAGGASRGVCGDNWRGRWRRSPEMRSVC